MQSLSLLMDSRKFKNEKKIFSDKYIMKLRSVPS